MANHTKEPWLVSPCPDDPYGDIEIYGENGKRRIAKLWLDDAPVEDFNGEQRANAARIVLCVNALAHVSTARLKTGELFNTLARLRETETQRDNLLAALKGLMDQVETPPDANCTCHLAPPCGDCVDYSGMREALDHVRSAIAAVEGKA